MDKIYEYEGRYYSDTDHSLEVEDGEWGGDLFDLFWDASNGSLYGVLCDSTVYYSVENPENVYESVEELVENYFDDSKVSLDDIKKKGETNEND